MTLAPLLDAPLTVMVHTALAIASVGVGAVVLVARKGTHLHVVLGQLWAAAMMTLAALSFVMTHGKFSWIHGLSVVTLTTVPFAIWRRRKGDIVGHAVAMSANYAGLVLAGVFTLAPGRILHRAFFG